MPSSKNDIVKGNIFRPRSVANQIKLRANDKCKITSYVPPNVGIEYISDGTQLVVSDTDLLREYKRTSSGAPLPAHSTSPEKPTFNVGPYTPGSLWITSDKEAPFTQHAIVKVIEQGADITVYVYVSHPEIHKNKQTDVFRKFMKPYEENKIVKVVSKCPHKYADWIGDIKCCNDCGEPLQVIDPMKNPYNTDPDLKKIPEHVTQFINRVAASIEG